jgi:starch synthase (maltosyl-transferring)
MSIKVLHVIQRLGLCGAAKQLTLLSLGLPRDRFAVAVAALDEDDACAQPLRRAGIPVHVFRRTPGIDLASTWKLRRLIDSYHPDVIHIWDAVSRRRVSVAKGRSCCPAVASNPLPACATKLKLPFLDRWLLGRAACVVARGPAEAARCQQAGVPQERIRLVPPAVDPTPWLASSEPLGLPVSSRLILCAGPLEAHHGFRDAIWALEILWFLFDDLHLVIAGAGPERVRLERFAVRNRIGDRVHLLGARVDIPDLLARSEIVCIPSLADTGMHIALEAMAAGKAIIASNVPSLRELITDRENGLLIPPGDKVALARSATLLLRQPDLAHRLGEAARRRAQAYSTAAFVDRFVRLYSDLCEHAPQIRSARACYPEGSKPRPRAWGAISTG